MGLIVDKVKDDDTYNKTDQHMCFLLQKTRNTKKKNNQIEDSVVENSMYILEKRMLIPRVPYARDPAR